MFQPIRHQNKALNYSTPQTANSKIDYFEFTLIIQLEQ